MTIKIIVDFLYAAGVIGNFEIDTLNAILIFPIMFLGIFCGQLITGTTTWIVMQILAVPLRPVSVRTALRATQKKWKRLLGTGLLSTGLTFLGLALCLIGLPILSVLFALVAPVVMMENIKGFAALKRSKNLVMRSLRTTIASVFILFFVPLFFGIVTSIFVMTTVKTAVDMKNKIMAVSQKNKQTSEENNQNEQIIKNTEASSKAEQDEKQINIKIGDEEAATAEDKSFREAIRDGLTNLILLPFQIVLLPLSSIIIALLYLKTRQVSGESMQDLPGQFEEADQPRTNWQRRVQARLMQSGKHTSKT